MTESAVPSNETWDVIRHLFEGGELCGQTTRTDDGDSHVCGCFRKPHADANHVCPCGSRWSTERCPAVSSTIQCRRGTGHDGWHGYMDQLRALAWRDANDVGDGDGLDLALEALADARRAARGINRP